MKLKLERPLVFFDLETTGTDAAKDRIVELSYIKVYPDGEEESKTMRVNPGCHIPEGASTVHGIYDEDVKDKPLFKDVAKQVAEVFKDSDIAGFNSNKFDVPMLAEEFLRASVLDVDFSICKKIDVQVIYHKHEPRTLSAAYKFYCNADLENAHSALADTAATYEVLKAQLDKYDDLENSVDFLDKYSNFTNNVDLDGKIVYDENGKEMINFGKYKGRYVADLLRVDPGYISWMLAGDFPLSTKQVLVRLREKYTGNK